MQRLHTWEPSCVSNNNKFSLGLIFIYMCRSFPSESIVEERTTFPFHRSTGYSGVSIFSGYLTPPCLLTSSIVSIITIDSSQLIPSDSNFPSLKHLAHSSASQNMPCPGMGKSCSSTFGFFPGLIFCGSLSSSAGMKR